MAQGNITQSVDITASLDVPARSTPDSFENLAIIEADIERVFGGGGSQAEVQVVFDGFLSQDEKDQIDSFVQSGPRDDNFVEYDSPAGRRANQLTLTVDVTSTVLTATETAETTRTLFTGTVIKVTESAERKVTISAIDRRHELNRNMVQLDISEPTPIEAVVKQVLDSTNNTGLQLDSDQYNIQSLQQATASRTGVSAGDSQPVRVNNLSYGVERHTTAYQVLQDLAKKANATIHIDNNNVINFVRFPSHVQYDSASMPPIVNWESGENETENDVVVKSPYDETGGGGLYTPMAEESIEETSQAVPPGKLQNEVNVFSRNAVRNAREYELLSDELLKDSGTIRVVGDPAIEPYDMFELDEQSVDGFAPISHGNYMAKTVRHVISQQDGYLTELALGEDPRKLFEQFATSASSTAAIDDSEENAGDGGSLWKDAFLSGFKESVVRTASPVSVPDELL